MLILLDLKRSENEHVNMMWFIGVYMVDIVLTAIGIQFESCARYSRKVCILSDMLTTSYFKTEKIGVINTDITATF
jgi:hypothetical protein